MAEPALQPTPLYTDAPRNADIQSVDLRSADLPSTDGCPLPDSDFQAGPLSYTFEALKHRYEDRMDVAVQSDMFVHYVDDGKKRKVAPDVFVIFGVPKKLRHSYIVWLEGKRPDFVMEILSKSTWQQDTGEKKDIYEKMGVQEYWMLEATERPVVPVPLVGYRLVDRTYEPIKPEPGRRTTYVSDVLGLELRFDANLEERLRLRDPATGRVLPSTRELRGQLEAALAGQRREAEARQAAEKRLAELMERIRDAD